MPTVWAPWPGKRKAVFPTLVGSFSGRSASALLFDLDDDSPHIVAAIRANYVGRPGRAALRAVEELLGLFEVVGPAAAGAGVGMLALRYGHDRSLCQSPAGRPTRLGFCLQ